MARAATSYKQGCDKGDKSGCARFAWLQARGEGVTRDYPGKMPWRFTGGTIKRVAVDVSGEPYADLEREAVAMLMRE